MSVRDRNCVNPVNFGNFEKSTSEIILIGASKFVITFQTHDINCVMPVGITEKGTISSQHLTWFFRSNSQK